MTPTQLSRLRLRAALARAAILTAGVVLVLSLGGCWTVYRTDEDASQRRDGVDITVLDVIDAARGPLGGDR